MDFDPVAYINEPRWRSSVYGLERISALMERLDNPERSLAFIHVAGTNGKGSTCAYLSHILQAAGYRTGLFTSPYLFHFEERIRVDGTDISSDELLHITLRVKDAAEEVEAKLGSHPTEFELMAAVAFCYFAEKHCDIAVVEVGLGGRLDATNVIESPQVCVITPIAMDHQELLGNTLSAIASEKAGIIKPGAAVVLGLQEPEAHEVLKEAAGRAACPLFEVSRQDLIVDPLGPDLGGHSDCRQDCRNDYHNDYRRDYRNDYYQDCRHFRYKGMAFQTRLLGLYQPENAACAIEAIRALRSRGWDVSDEALGEGIASTRWPGRFDWVALSPLTIIDGGHNLQGAQALRRSLEELIGFMGDMGEISGMAFEDSSKIPEIPETPKVTFVMGVLADKDYQDMICEILPLADGFFTYTPSNPRALSAEDLATTIEELASGQGLPVDRGRSCNQARTCNQSQQDDKDLSDDLGRSHNQAQSSVLYIETAEDPAEALAQARSFAGSSGIVVAFGSLYSQAQLYEAIQTL